MYAATIDVAASGVTQAAMHHLHTVQMRPNRVQAGYAGGNCFVVPLGELRKVACYAFAGDQDDGSGYGEDAEEVVEADGGGDGITGVGAHFCAPSRLPKVFDALLRLINVRAARSLRILRAHCVAQDVLRRDTMSPLVKAALIHWNLAVVHPYADGNGRITRLIASLPLTAAGLPPIVIPLACRAAYLDALASANAGDLTPLVLVVATAATTAIDYIAQLPPTTAADNRFRTGSHDGATTTRKHLTRRRASAIGSVTSDR
jgi:hypothetical protein